MRNPAVLERDPADLEQKLVVIVCDTQGNPTRLLTSLRCVGLQDRQPDRVIVGTRSGELLPLAPGEELGCEFVTVRSDWSVWLASIARTLGDARVAVLDAGQYWPVQRLDEMAARSGPVVWGPCGFTHPGGGGERVTHRRLPEPKRDSDADLERVRHASTALWEASELAARVERSLERGRPRVNLRPASRVNGTAVVYMEHEQEATRAEMRRLAALPGLEQFRDRHRGQRAFVVGNGPSLGRMDLAGLNDEITFASNAIFLLFRKGPFRPKYYACIDSVVLPDRADDIRRMLVTHPEIHGFFPRSITDHDIPGFKWWVPSVIGYRPNASFFDSQSVDLERSPHRAVSLRPWEYLCEGATVTITLLQLAILMGCNPIYLIGCDTDYVLPAGTVVCREATARRDARLISTGADPNHFDPDYFGQGRIWHQPNPELMVRHYRLLRSIYEPRGVQVFNAGIGGKLNVFPRVDFASIRNASKQEAMVG